MASLVTFCQLIRFGNFIVPCFIRCVMCRYTFCSNLCFLVSKQRNVFHPRNAPQAEIGRSDRHSGRQHANKFSFRCPSIQAIPDSHLCSKFPGSLRQPKRHFPPQSLKTLTSAISDDFN